MADRSVTVRLRVNTTAFSSGMTRAQRDAANLTRRLDQTGASAERMRRRLEAATRALPAIKIDADASGAQRKVDELRRELVSLSGRRIGIDVSTAQALGEIQRVERELEQLALASPDVQVQADVAAAMAELATVRREIAQLDGATPTVHARVDASDAVRTLEDLRARMDALASRRIGVDVDARAARAEIEDIQRQLEILSRTTADPQVRLEVDRALADLRRVDVELSRLDGRVVRPRIDIDVSGALAGIAAVSAALSSLPIAATIGVAAAAFSSAAAGAAGFAAVAVPSLNRINEALQQQETLSHSAGGATQSLAAKQAQAAATALQLAEAQDRVRDANERVREAKQRLADTVQDVAYRQEMANRRVEDAERALAEAHRATQRALEDLNRAREEARERLEDLALATERGALSEERARLNILRAQQELARVMSDPKATALDRQEAQLRLKEAQLTLKEVQERNADLAKEYEEAKRKGIESSDQVRAAKERLAQATQRELDAERALQDARREAARVAIEGQRAIARAQAEVLRAQREAERAAQRLRVQQLQAQAALEKAGGSAGRAAWKMKELSEEERKLADQIKNLQDKWEEWQRSLQPDVFPVISKGIDLILQALPKLSPLVRTASKSFLTLMEDAEKALKSEAFTDFLKQLEQQMPTAIEGLGRTTGNMLAGMLGFIQALLPHTKSLVDTLEDASARFAQWGQGLKASPEFEQFIRDMVANAPKIMEVLGNLGTFLGNLAKAGAGGASVVLDLMVKISETLAGLSPEQLQQLAVGVGAFMAALKLGATLKLGGLMLLVEVISRMDPDEIRTVALAITALVAAVKGFQTVRGVVDFFTNLRGAIAGAGTAAHTAAGRFAGLRGVLVGGGIAAAVAGIAVAAGNLDRVVSGLSPDIDNLAKGLTEFAKGGKPTKEVLDTMVGNVSTLRAIPGIPVLNDMRDLRDVVAQMASDKIWDRAATGIGNFLNTIGGPLGVTLDHGAKRLQNMDQALAHMVRSGNADQAAKLFNAVTERAREAGVPLDRLRALFPQYTAAVSSSVKPTQDAAGAFGKARSELDQLNSSMSRFSAHTEYARFIQDMKASYDSLTQALKQTGGNLDITRAKTDAQREAVIQARQRFEEYIQKVQELGNRQKELTGSTENARQAVLNQIGVLLTLAGRSKEARERVYALAQSFGITREEANKAKGKVDDVKRSLDKLQNKTIKVSADTSKAEQAIQTLINKYKGYKVITNIDPKTGRFYTTMVPAADGMILRFANGGAVRSFANGAERHVAQIARPGTIRIWAEPETGGEAYIPLARSKRPRSLAILRQVADQFGYLVVPKPEDRATVPATTPSGGQVGTVTVDLNNLDNVTLAVGYTARVITKAMAEAANTTAGSTDDLTSTIDESNTTLVGVSSTLQEAIDRLSSAIDNLAAQVAGLSSAAYDVSNAVVAVGGSTGAATKSSSSATTKPGLIAPAPPAGAGGLIPGSQPTKTLITVGSNAIAVVPTFARGGLVTGPALVGEAGPEMVVPLSAGMRSRGVQTLQEAAARLGYTVMPSYMVGGGGGGLSRELRELRAAVDRLAARAGLGGGVNVHVTNHYPQAEPTSVTVNRGLQYAANLGMLG